MNRIAASLLLAALLLPLSACFKHTFHVGNGAPVGPVVYDHWHNHWIFGIVGEEEVDIAQICPSGNATIHEETTFLNGLIQVLIGPIYAPTTVTVRCEDGRSAQVELSAEAVSKILQSPAFLEAIRLRLPERAGDVEDALDLQ